MGIEYVGGRFANLVGWPGKATLRRSHLKKHLKVSELTEGMLGLWLDGSEGNKGFYGPISESKL